MKLHLNRFHSPMITAAAVVMAAVLAPDVRAAGAQGDERSHRVNVELFASSFFDDGINEENVGVRGAYFFTDRFALEGSASHFDVDSDLGFWILDLSAKYYFRPRSRVRPYLVGGPGQGLQNLGDLGDGPLLLHLGFGAEFSLGRRFYLRPELRGRWVDTDFERSGGDLSVGFGWSF